MPNNPAEQLELLKDTHYRLAKIHDELEAEMETKITKQLAELIEIAHEDIHECLKYVSNRKIYLRHKIKER